GATIDVMVEANPQLSLDEEMALLRIAQEALQNALKHADGAPINLLMRRTRAGTELVIRDGGPGYAMDELPRTTRTMGLSTMQDRAAGIGAALDLVSSPGAGSEVRAFLPAGRPLG
ncbi:MAG: sensor histidine kinase, partial [Candidatus Dormibacteraeota bacterium]|nr:sensor histidine kinase [Candidatus Dormibacteraeota bacterium]